MRYLNLFALAPAVSMPPALPFAGRRHPNPGAFAMSLSGAKVAPAKAPVEDKKERHENGKESAK